MHPQLGHQGLIRIDTRIGRGKQFFSRKNRIGPSQKTERLGFIGKLRTARR